MKMNRLWLFLMIVISLVMLGGCDFLNLPLSVEDRILNFEEDLNAIVRGASTLRGNFSENVSQYSQMADIDYWNSAFPQINSYDFSNIITTTNTATATLTVSVLGVGIDYSASFTMDEESNGNFLIRTFNSDFLPSSILNIK